MAFSSSPEAKSSHTTAFNRKTLSTVMCFIWQDDKRSSWFRSEWYKRPPRMYWYSALCLWAAIRMHRGLAQSRASLGCSSSHVLLCNCALQRPLCAWGTVQEIIWIFCIFSSLNVCMCVHSNLCVWESEWGLCGCFLFVYIPPLYEKAKATNVICVLFYGHLWKNVSGRSGW